MRSFYSTSWVAFVGTSETFGDKSDNYAYLKYTDKVEHNGGDLFAGTYKWDRIQSVEDFIANENKDNIYHGAVIDINYATKLTDEAMTELQGKKWVLRFAETDYTFWYGDGANGSFSTIVGDVTILGRIANGRKFPKKVKENACKFYRTKGLEVYRRVGTLARKETFAFSRNVLYSRRNVAGRNDDKEYV